MDSLPRGGLGRRDRLAVGRADDAGLISILGTPPAFLGAGAVPLRRLRAGQDSDAAGGRRLHDAVRGCRSCLSTGWSTVAVTPALAISTPLWFDSWCPGRRSARLRGAHVYSRRERRIDCGPPADASPSRSCICSQGLLRSCMLEVTVRGIAASIGVGRNAGQLPADQSLPDGIVLNEATERSRRQRSIAI